MQWYFTSRKWYSKRPSDDYRPHLYTQKLSGGKSNWENHKVKLQYERNNNIMTINKAISGKTPEINNTPEHTQISPDSEKHNTQDTQNRPPIKVIVNIDIDKVNYSMEHLQKWKYQQTIYTLH